MPVMIPQIGELLLRRTLDRFDREVDPDGQPWVDLTDATQSRKKRAGAGDKKKLVRERTLRDSIKVIRGGLDSTFVNTGAGLRIGIDGNTTDSDGELVSVYARIQNRHRRFLGVGRLDVKAVDSLLRRAGEQAVE